MTLPISWFGRITRPQLATMSDGTDTWTYSYNADGLRTSRTNGTKTYQYNYNGSKLTSMSIDGTMLYFTYDANGTPICVSMNGIKYFYALNLQGDVVALLNYDGTVLVEYTYDAWGNVLSITGTKASGIGVKNPLRYRGYVYDTETGLYYLQSRYYDPELGRFISSDLLIDNRGLITQNLFQYCGNNPVNNVDPSGRLFGGIIGIAVLIVGVVAVLSGCSNTSSDTSSVSTKTTSPHLPSTSPITKQQIIPTHKPTQQEKSYAATVYAEAGGQNKRSKQAVAHVMNNRIGTRSSWTDIEAVISAKYQFDGYGSTMYNNAMEYYSTGLWDNPIERAAMDECMAVIIPIYSGTEADITGGALYFHSFTNPSDWVYHNAYTQVYISGTEGFWFYK